MEAPPTAFVHPIGLRWADLDPNGHVRHSVYYDWGAIARIAYLQGQGVGLDWMVRHGVGPVLFREEAKFLREVRLTDEVKVELLLAASSVEGRKWRMFHRFFRGAELAATLEVDGAWLDLKARKVVAPPDEMGRAFAALGRTADFSVLTSGKPAGST
jgi:acyl-CoA thioester hydrolase